MLILDAYNILHQYSPDSPVVDDASRNRFIKQCIGYARLKKMKIMIVFDGGPFIWPYKETASKLVTLAYAGIRASADDYIKEFVEHNKGRQLIVVSNDNALQAAVRSGATQSLSVQQFLGYLHQAKSMVHDQRIAGQTKKLAESSQDALDALMYEAADALTHAKNEDYKQDRTSSSEQPSKAERQKSKRLKKL